MNHRIIQESCKLEIKKTRGAKFTLDYQADKMEVSMRH